MLETKERGARCETTYVNTEQISRNHEIQNGSENLEYHGKKKEGSIFLINKRTIKLLIKIQEPVRSSKQEEVT